MARFFTGSVYGAAGSLVILLYFVYYSAQMLFFGAEFTYVYANKYGSSVRPSAYATVFVRQERQATEKPAAPLTTPPPLADNMPLAETPTRRLEIRTAAGLVSMAVVLLIAFLIGRKTS
jgi:hypothetical protein